MTNKIVNYKGINAIQGDIFNLEDNNYDIAIAFVAGGFSGINASFRQNYKRIQNSILPYLIYSDKKNEINSKFYKSRIELFDSATEFQEYIDLIVTSALEDAARIGERIAISGMWIRGLDQIKNETWMIESILRWLDTHPNAEVTIVDISDNINKHGILKEKHENC